MKKKSRGYKYDFEALKREWLKTDITINQFRIGKGISQAYFYKTIDADEWEKSRQNINKIATYKIEEKAAQSIANKWEDYTRLWGAVKAQAATLLRKTRNPDGSITPLTPPDLRNLTASIETALKCERLIVGESTENVKSDNANIHTIAVQVLKVINGPTDIDPARTIPAA